MPQTSVKGQKQRSKTTRTQDSTACPLRFAGADTDPLPKGLFKALPAVDFESNNTAMEPCAIGALQATTTSIKMSPEELKSIFEKYAAKEGDPDQLSKEELKLLIQTEFPSLLKGPSTLDELFQELDKNGDGEVSFEEFQVLVNKISQ
ncbi:protein S100-G [Halichoerus grypus]|uniref:protein S100-G n=1 Tax=Phoca vitulina TaxID=9720 RepID=UPI0013964DD8|nr:protein S100-G [Phoca vitulina]